MIDHAGFVLDEFKHSFRAPVRSRDFYHFLRQPGIRLDHGLDSPEFPTPMGGGLDDEVLSAVSRLTA